MTRLFRLACITALFSLSAFPAAAQTPDTGTIGAGADIGAFLPDDAFEGAFTLDGFGELYVTPRASVRGMLAWTSPGFDGRTEDHFRQVKLLFDGVYNWEMGVWHPFVMAGAGVYFVRQSFEDRADPPGENRGGLNFGGGAEYFINQLTTIKGELRWDLVSHPTGLPDATGLSLTIGLKRYY
jgi:hypothetical protein